MQYINYEQLPALPGKKLRIAKPNKAAADRRKRIEAHQERKKLRENLTSFDW